MHMLKPKYSYSVLRKFNNGPNLSTISGLLQAIHLYRHTIHTLYIFGTPGTSKSKSSKQL